MLDEVGGLPLDAGDFQLVLPVSAVPSLQPLEVGGGGPEFRDAEPSVSDRQWCRRLRGET